MITQHKACPFCGAAAELRDYADRIKGAGNPECWGLIVEHKPDCFLAPQADRSDAEAAQAWDQRIIMLDPIHLCDRLTGDRQCARQHGHVGMCITLETGGPVEVHNPDAEAPPIIDALPFKPLPFPCQTCCYFRPDERAEYAKAGNGYCRRFPPVVVTWTAEGYSGPQFEQHYPYVAPGDGCGEHKPKGR